MPKTFKHLYPQICAYENLYAAFRAARKNGKRQKQNVAAFEYHLETELARLRKISAARGSRRRIFARGSSPWKIALA